MVFAVIVSLHAKDDVEEQLRAKLAEASKIYSKDAGVLGWHPLQSTDDSRKWTIVQLLDQESSVEKHREDPEYKALAASLVSLLENGQEGLHVHRFQGAL
ncbi:hypothetical protein PHYPSEUDO_013645 [Phytophthora pseudosyringae]|uniref:ABM domain-containing protein n=1 Tax=Phytophthora pseudosyringae TaxID=221518 RepID=A0A8T1V537_9STRA|nr:hypothetical protein PHYPSEUDO_013645 [Phytophthora pseudosyringae]